QFKPGTSGNAKGRTPKPRAPVPVVPVPPTTELLREEATRLVTIKEGDKRTSITTTRAVMRSLGHKAMQGGVLAARTYLEYVIADDEREFTERRRIFDFWRKYVADSQAAIERAEARGETAELVPHPDDLVFDFDTLNVRIAGPYTVKHATTVAWLKQASELFYELSRYYDEPFVHDPADLKDSKAGNLFFLALLAQRGLP